MIQSRNSVDPYNTACHSLRIVTNAITDCLEADKRAEFREGMYQKLEGGYHLNAIQKGLRAEFIDNPEFGILPYLAAKITPLAQDFAAALRHGYQNSGDNHDQIMKLATRWRKAQQLSHEDPIMGMDLLKSVVSGENAAYLKDIRTMKAVDLILGNGGDKTKPPAVAFNEASMAVSKPLGESMAATMTGLFTPELKTTERPQFVRFE